MGTTGLFTSTASQTIAVVVGSGSVILLLIVVLVIVWNRQRRRKHFDVTLDELDRDVISVKSEPSSRSTSPKQSKRMSCPDALSVTVDRIPDFTLPPERVQPRHSIHSAHAAAVPFQHGVIGHLQPDLYSHTGSTTEEEEGHLSRSSHGRLWYSLVYDAAVEQLNVTLVKVKDLPGRGCHNQSRDPFVKVFVLPDDRTCRTSKVRKKTLSPIYNETFLFSVPASEVKERTLRFSVYDVDKKKVRHSLGHVMVPLRDVDLAHVETYIADLDTMTQVVSTQGELEVGLCYQPHSEKIKINIMKARHLKHADMDQESRLYLRLQLYYGRKVHRTKRTSCRHCSGTLDEVDFNESLSFSISGKQLDSCRLEMALMLTPQPHGAPMLAHDVEHGRVVIGPFMFARGEELMHWQEMMASPRSVITRWHALSSTVAHD